MDIWGQGISVTVSAGKNGPSRAFIFCSCLWGFLSFAVWPSGHVCVHRGTGQTGQEGTRTRCPRDFRASGFSDVFQKLEYCRHSRGGCRREGPPVGESQDPLGGRTVWSVARDNLAATIIESVEECALLIVFLEPQECHTWKA